MTLALGPITTVSQVRATVTAKVAFPSTYPMFTRDKQVAIHDGHSVEPKLLVQLGARCPVRSTRFSYEILRPPGKNFQNLSNHENTFGLA